MISWRGCAWKPWYCVLGHSKLVESGWLLVAIHSPGLLVNIYVPTYQVASGL